MVLDRWLQIHLLRLKIFCSCMQKHSKVYRDELEELHHYTIWQSKRALVNEHNHHASEFGYTLTMNKFSDMSNDEITIRYKGLVMEEQLVHSNVTKYFQPSGQFKPLASVDWRDMGAVTPVKNQKQCGSCWAFSATGAIEGQHFLKTKQLVSLSEQNLIDCSGSWGNHGCNGGNMFKAFNYTRDNGGIDTEESYPYGAVNGTCRFSAKSKGATVTGYVRIPFGDESALMEAVTKVGPIAVAIDASDTTFHQYSGGVYYNPVCSTRNLDHAVLVVGYGTLLTGQDYWLVKNSWGADWGMDGYIRMARNKNNHCGIVTSAVYPTV